MSSRSGHQETGAELDEDLLKQHFLVHSREQRLTKNCDQAEAEIDAKNWEKRSIKNLNLNDFSYIKKTDGQISKLVWGVRTSQNVKQKDCQEIEELKSICCEEPDQVRSARSWTPINSGFTEQSEFLVRCERIFTILNQGGQLWSDPRS